MKTEIKAHIEKVPFILVMINCVCFYWFWISPDTYNYFELLIGDITQVSLVFIIVLYSLSSDWGFIAKRSLLCLVALWASNFLAALFGIEFSTYIIIYMSLIYTVFLGLFIWTLCNR